MEKETPKQHAKKMYNHFYDNTNNVLTHFEILEECKYICNERIKDSYKIDIKYYKEYVNFWHEVLMEFNLEE